MLGVNWDDDYRILTALALVHGHGGREHQFIQFIEVVGDLPLIDPVRQPASPCPQNRSSLTLQRSPVKHPPRQRLTPLDNETDEKTVILHCQIRDIMDSYDWVKIAHFSTGILQLISDNHSYGSTTIRITGCG